MARHIYSENQPLGLDEIMIVNPTPGQAGLHSFGYPDQAGTPDQDSQLFLGEDGTLYGLLGPQDPLQEGDLLLGQDGRLYRVAIQPNNGDSIFLG